MSESAEVIPRGDEFDVEFVSIDSLEPHPRNYQDHPDDQLDEIGASLMAHGFFKNVVVAEDGTILAGHGVVAACRRLGVVAVPIRRMPYPPADPRALQIVAADNELTRRAERDDRGLAELLHELHEAEMLPGTGYDEERLAALLFTTRPTSEVPDMAAAKKLAANAGSEGFDSGEEIACRVIFNLTNVDEVESLFRKVGASKDHVTLNRKSTLSLRWPLVKRRPGGTLSSKPGDAK